MKTWQDELIDIKPGSHAVQCCTDKNFLGRMVGFYVQAGYEKNSVAVIICKRANFELFEHNIEIQSGESADALKESGKLFMFEAEKTLSLFLENGVLDPEKFEAIIGKVLEKAAQNGPVRAYGEMVDILWGQGDKENAIQLEKLWNDLLAREKFCLLCAYTLDSLAPEIYDNSFEEVCQTHSAVLPQADPFHFHATVSKGLDKALGFPMASMVTDLAMMDDRRPSVPDAQKLLLWLSRHMPRTVRKILSLVQK